MQITGRMVARRVHPHSDVGHLLAATFDASSSSTTASSHIPGWSGNFPSNFFLVFYNICVATRFNLYILHKGLHYHHILLIDCDNGGIFPVTFPSWISFLIQKIWIKAYFNTLAKFQREKGSIHWDMRARCCRWWARIKSGCEQMPHVWMRMDPSRDHATGDLHLDRWE